MGKWRQILLSTFIINGVYFINSSAFAECYSYDDLGRLVDVVYDPIVTYDKQFNVVSTRTGANIVFELDDHGNRQAIDAEKSSTRMCDEPDGITSDGQTNAASSEIYGTGQNGSANASETTEPQADTEVITMVPNAQQTVTPLVGDTGLDVASQSLSSFATSSNLISVTQSGDSLVIQSGGILGQATIDYTVTDDIGQVATGTIQIVIISDDTQSNCTNGASEFGCDNEDTIVQPQ